MVDEGPDTDEGCNRVEDLGAEPDPLFERDLRARGEVDSVSCDAPAALNGSWLGRMRFSENVSVEIKVDGLPRPDDELTFPAAPFWELREAACQSGSVLACGDERTRTFQLQADTTYYLVVNGELDFGGVQVQITLTDLVCEPDFSGCADSALQVCNSSGLELTSAACVAECASVAACQADACTEALDVALTVGTPVTLEGDRAAYAHTWSSEGLEGCNPYEPGPGGPSDGVEFFVRFGGLTSGQTLVLDAEQSTGNVGFYVLPQCDPTTCVGAYIFDTSNRNRAEIPIAADGELLVAFEAIGADLNREFVIEAELQP